MKKIARYLFFSTVFLNIWFPKSGTKIVGIPLTLGNVFFGLMCIAFLLVYYKEFLKKNDIYKSFFIMLLYFLVRILLCVFVGHNKISDAIQYLVPLVIYPIMYVCTYNFIQSKKDLEKIMKLLIYGFVFLFVYSMMQYFIGIDKVTIPGITMNLADYTGPAWYLEKFNGFLDSTKIFSTYQNGNIYGIGLILIFPIIFEYMHKKNKKQSYILLGMFIVAILLTLSRSCWFGLGIYLCVRFLFVKSENVKVLLIKIAMIPTTLVGANIIFKKFPQILKRITSTSVENLVGLGGRSESLIAMYKSLLKTDSFFIIFIGFYGIYSNDGGAYEITLPAIWMVGGIIGVVLWIYNLYFGYKKCGKDSISTGVKYSIIIWFFVSFIEGGYWLPPTALNLWFIIALGNKAKEIYQDETSKEGNI